MPSIEEFIKARNSQYQDAWLKTGLMAKPVVQEIALLLLEFPEAWYSWVIILNKLVRILGDHRHIDSWRDIAGYATLVVEHLEKENKK